MTTTPSIRTQVFATLKRCTVIVGILAGLAFGYQAGVTEAATATPTTAAVPTVQAEPQEDDPAFDCRIHGNDICGPTGEFEAGCYSDGVLTIPWRDDMRGVGRAGCTQA